VASVTLLLLLLPRVFSNDQLSRMVYECDEIDSSLLVGGGGGGVTCGLI